MKIEIGQAAPNFTLYDSAKNKVTLSDLRGHTILLLFFPLAFTSTCTAELCSIRDNIFFFNNVNAKVFGISVDSLHTLSKFRSEQSLNFSLLSDFNKEISSLYGSLYEMFSYNMKGVSKRSAFVIDKDGIIRYAEVLENAGEQPDLKNITLILERLK